MDRAIKILFLAANPKDTSQLRLDEEMRAIDQTLRQAEFRDRFEIKQHWAVRVVDLQGYLLRHQPDIVHFSGHGSAANEIILEDNAGDSQPVSSHVLSQLFSVLKDNIRCVVLNACYSEQQAQAIAKHIACVVGMSKAIEDAASISFSVAFYQALGFGRDIKTAFELGCVQIGLEKLDDQDAPKLLAINSNSMKYVFVQRINKQPNDSLETNPPELLQKHLWLLLNWRRYWKVITAAAIIIIVSWMITKLNELKDNKKTYNEELLPTLGSSSVQYNQLHEISNTLSEYIFAAELVIEAYDKNLTTLPNLIAIVRENYNPAIAKLRSREYVYIESLIELESIELSSQFQEIMATVKKLDGLLRQFNPQAEKIESGKQLKADTTFTASIVRKVNPIFNELKSESDEFLLKLSRMNRK